MAFRNGIDWIKERRTFVAGVAVAPIVAIAVVIGLVLANSSSGTKSTATSSSTSLPPQPSTVAAAPTSSNPSSTAPSSSTSGSPVPSSAAAGASGQDSGPISLAGWKLTLPVNKAGALSGKAKELQTAALTAPWLVRNPDGSLSFWAPATGATTSNSEHSRTELVSDNNFTFGTGVHTMSATLSVTQVPDNDHDIDVGQIHGGGSINSIPFVMLHWRDGSIVVIVKTELHGSSSQSVTLLTGVPLDARFSYSMTDDGNGSLTLSASYNGQSQQSTVQVVAAFIGTDERFQVGDYEQAVSGTSPTDGGRVTFYSITTS
jgi:hypothetical protein